MPQPMRQACDRLDHRPRFASVVKKAYDEICAIDPSIAKLLQKFSFADAKTVQPIQAADFLAYEIHKLASLNITAPKLRESLKSLIREKDRLLLIPVFDKGYHANLESPVREAAVVYINDRRIGSIWAPPYALDITGALRAGSNRIRIEVGNLALNHMAAKGYPNYNLQGVRQKYGNRFDPQGLNLIQPTPSGLLGPVQIIAAQKTN
jgi:hypothetical protein